MDVISAIMLFFIVFFILSCCGYCCSSKRKGTVFSTPVVVTSVTTAAPGGYQMSPGGYPAQVYTAPYPSTGMPQGMVAVAMPMPTNYPQMQPHYVPGVSAQMVPYPSIGMAPGPSMNPPSYDVVVGQGSGAQQQSGAPLPYEKQAAYNPNYAPQ